MSIKCKGSTIQCTSNKKIGDYCGKHSKCKNVARYDYLYNNPQELDAKNNKDKSIIENLELIKKSVLSKNMGQYKVYYLRQIIKYHNLNINTKQSKSCLVKSLYYYFMKLHNYEKDINKIIFIQKNMRRKLILNKSQCNNSEDLISLESIYDIPDIYFMKILDTNGYYYGFDIRALDKMLKNNNKNPYTLNNFSNREIVKINRKIEYLKNKSFIIELKEDELSEEKRLELKMIDVFHNFDLLDNYTCHTWFYKLNLNQLKRLYHFTEDIWNYRTDLTLDMKKNIVKDGIAFNIPVHVIKKIKHKINLQKIILNEYERFINEGLSRDDKKLGVMLLLTGLVEVSDEAAFSMPHLVQVF